MKLTKLTLENFKGFSGTYEFATMTIFVGANFAGKSTVIDAIRLLLLGYLPELGKTNPATFALSSGRSMLVEGTFDTGETASRRWFVKDDSIKSAFVLPEWMEDKAAAGTFAVMMDPQVYFGLSEAERVTYVFAMMPGVAEAVTCDALAAQLTEMLTAKTSELAPDAIAAFSAEIRTHLEKLARAGISTNALVEALLEYVKTAASNAKAKANVMEKTAQGLAVLRSADAEVVDLPAVTQALAQAQAALEKLRDDRAKLVAENDAGLKQQPRRAKLERELVGAEARKQAAEQARARAAALTVKVGELVEQVKDTDLQAMMMEERDQTASLREIAAELERHTERLLTLQQEKMTLDEMKCCPYCGATTSPQGDWRASKKSAIEATMAGLESKQATLRLHSATLTESVQNLRSRLEQARAAQTQRDRLLAERAAAMRDLEAADRAVVADDDRRKQLAEMPVVEVNVDAINALGSRLAAAQQQVDELTRKRQQLNGRANDLQRLAQAEKQRDEAKMAEQVAKAAVEATRALKAKIVTAAFHDLLLTANAFFEGVLRSPLAYHQGEIGTWRDGLWISHRTFSGTERALTFAAIQAALTAHATFRLMLVDELARLDDASASMFISGVDKGITAGVIDQFIGVDTGRGAFYGQSAAMAAQDLTVTEIAAKQR